MEIRRPTKPKEPMASGRLPPRLRATVQDRAEKLGVPVARCVQDAMIDWVESVDAEFRRRAMPNPVVNAQEATAERWAQIGADLERACKGKLARWRVVPVQKPVAPATAPPTAGQTVDIRRLNGKVERFRL
jgi:hypothetical protein